MSNLEVAWPYRIYKLKPDLLCNLQRQHGILNGTVGQISGCVKHFDHGHTKIMIREC